MKLRNALILAGLVALAGGCTVGGYEEPMYGPGYPVYSDTDAYGGYFYVQIIYIDGEPWYVDDSRHAHPIPPNLRGHFRNSGWARSLPPRFGHDDAVRDGYQLSRIVYVNDVPVYVDDDRRARPIPAQERSRFSYQGVVRPGDFGRNGRPPQPFPQPRYDTAPRQMPPAYGREPERQQPPAFGREREMPPANGRMQERQAPPAFGRERQGSPSYGPQPTPRPQMMPEHMRERPMPPSDRDGRGGPQGRQIEQPSDRGPGMGRPMPQERARKPDDGQRGGAADQRGNGKAGGDGRRQGGDGQDKRRGMGNPPD